MTADRNAGRLLAAHRRVVDRCCRRCGDTFPGLVTALYCGDPCRLKAFRLRRRNGRKPG